MLEIMVTLQDSSCKRFWCRLKRVGYHYADRHRHADVQYAVRKANLCFQTTINLVQQLQQGVFSVIKCTMWAQNTDIALFACLCLCNWSATGVVFHAATGLLPSA